MKMYERKLRATGHARFEGMLVGRVTKDTKEHSLFATSQNTIQIIKKGQWTAFSEGFHIYIFEDEENRIPLLIRMYLHNLQIPYMTLVDQDCTFLENDVVLLNDPPNCIKWLYRADSSDNVLLVTNQCNSNCIMCPDSEYLRKNSLIAPLPFLLDWVNHIPQGVEYLCISGGEPTLLKDDLFLLLNRCKERLPECQFLMLSNGRMFVYPGFLSEYIQNRPPGMILGIPLHSMRQDAHDFITGEEGSFQQTVAGISKLQKAGEAIELRVVVQQHNARELTELAAFIASRFPRTLRVNFMSLEMLGNALKNKDQVWIPFEDVHEPLRQACLLLIQSGIPVQLYNFPLCHLPEQLWTLTVKSISDHKVRFSSSCSECGVMDMCGGFFSTTMQLFQHEVFPITE